MFDRLPVSIRRYELGLNLGNSGAWDRLRETDPSYSTGGSRGDWIERANESTAVASRARALAAVIRPLQASSIVSYGSGTCILEWHLSSFLDARIVCADYAVRTVERMRHLFPEAEHVVHDLGEDDPIEADLHILHRVDSEFDDARLSLILHRFRQPVLLVAAEPALTPRLWLTYKRRARSPDFGPVGWCRTRASLERLWRSSHEATSVEVCGRDAWLLRPVRSAPAIT